MKVETQTLTGRLLNFYVAKALAYTLKRIDREVTHEPSSYITDTYQHGWLVYKGDELLGAIADDELSTFYTQTFSPSTDWNQAGPIIHKHKISLLWEAHEFLWSAHEPEESFIKGGRDFVSQRLAYDAEPLVAAMRCLVMMKIGMEVTE